MPELIPVNIVIGDRTYRIKTNPEDEEVIRKTVKTINDKVIEFKTQFSGQDMQDYIAMVIIWYATQAAEQSKSGAGQGDISEVLKKLESQMDKYLCQCRAIGRLNINGGKTFLISGCLNGHGNFFKCFKCDFCEVVGTVLCC